MERFVLSGGESIYTDDSPEAVQGFLMLPEEVATGRGSGRCGRRGPVISALERLSGQECYANSWGVVSMKTRLSAFPGGQRDGAYHFSAGLLEWLHRFDKGADVSPVWLWRWEGRRLLSLSTEELDIRGVEKSLFQLPGDLRVEVAERHIEKGQRESPTSCPLALGFADAVEIPVFVMVDAGVVSAAQGCQFQYRLTERLASWVRQFDDGEPVPAIEVGVHDIHRYLDIRSFASSFAASAFSDAMVRRREEGKDG